MAVIRLDKIAGTHLESGIYTAELLNGNIVQLGSLVAGETNLYNVKVATTDADLAQEFLLHSSVEVDPNPLNAGLKNFKVAVGDSGRFYHLEVGDIITLTADLFDGVPVVGQYAVPQLNSVKLEASVDGKTLNTEAVEVEPRLQFVVIQETTLGFDASQAFALRVVKA